MIGGAGGVAMMQRGVVSVGKLWYRWRSVTVNAGKADAVARKLGAAKSGAVPQRSSE